MTWRSTPADRTAFHNQARTALNREDWWQQVYDTAEEMVSNIPDTSNWVPSAQTTTSEFSFTYTVLNAWTLAMGLDPESSFAPSGHETKLYSSELNRSST
jgi:hypothetical protein